MHEYLPRYTVQYSCWTVWRLCKGNCVEKKKRKKSNNKKISLNICTKQGVNLKIRWGNGSPEGLDWLSHSALESEIGGSSLQRCEGKYDAFLCCVLHYGTWYDWECIFLECLRGGESLSLFPDCHLVMGDFIHHDKACISASIFEAVPFKML